VEGAVLQGVLIDKPIEMLFECAGHCTGSPRARSIQQALWPLLRKALYPFSEGGIGQVEGRRDGVDMVACHDLADGLRPAKDPSLLGLLQYGL
jgi:hypothetical protein